MSIFWPVILFQETPEPQDLLVPEMKSMAFGLRRIRQVHEMERFDPAEKFVHLFLAVAGGLSDQKIAGGEVRTGVGNGISIAGFDQRAEIGGKGPFGIRDRFFFFPAQADRYGPRGPHKLDGRKKAVNARRLSCRYPSTRRHRAENVPRIFSKCSKQSGFS